MMRVAVAALALSGSLGGLYGGVAMGVGGGDPVIDPEETSHDHSIDLIATPLIIGDRIQGYVIGRYVIEIDLSQAEALGTPIAETVAHGINDFFYRNARNTYWVGGELTVPEIVEGVRGSINKQAGYDLASMIAVRQLDFLQSPEVRQPVISFGR